MKQIKHIILLPIAALLLNSCATAPKAMTAATAKSLKPKERINWPANYLPEEAPFTLHNEISINASPQTVWRELIDYKAWPTYYKGADPVTLADASQTTLQANSVMHWKTMGLKFTSTIKEYEPNRRLSWESVNSKITGYHAWLIVPQGKGCKLITDEAQHGWLTFFQKTFVPTKLSRLHDDWLTGIKERAEARKS